MIWHNVVAWLLGYWRKCLICGGGYDIRRAKGQILLESWPNSNHYALCCCPGDWIDVDYVHHTDPNRPQTNSLKPHNQIRARRRP